jgi:hypothetical protein
MDMLSTAKRKDALPDPAKINPLLLKRVSEVTQKATAKNSNKIDVAEAVRRAVDRPSLSIKGQPTSGVAVSGSTFHCSVEQVVGGGNFWKTAEAKGSDRGSATSILQFSEPVQHNSDDVMTSIPADYGSRELVQLLDLVRQSFPGEFTWRHVAGGGFGAADALAVAWRSIPGHPDTSSARWSWGRLMVRVGSNLQPVC